MKRFSKSIISIVLACILCFSLLPTAMADEVTSTSDEEAVSSTVYLSDIKYQSASVGYGSLHLDGNMSDSTISLYVDGNRFYFDKGVTAHATSTLVYNLTDYSDYNYFTSYIGVDASQGGKGNVIFRIYTSVDGNTWTTAYTSGELTSSSESEFVTIDISEVNYLKLVTDSNGGNGNDHSTFADAKLLKSLDDGLSNCEGLKTVEQYDEILAEYKNGRTDYADLLEDSEFTHILLQRSFVKNAGYNTLSLLCERDEKYAKVIDWLLNDDYDALYLYSLGGKPWGSYQTSMEVLYDMLEAHGDDMNDSEYGDLYKKMIISISLAYSSSVYAWYDSSAVSDPVYRYEIYKDLHSEGLLWNDIFENLTVEEMCWVFNNMMKDDEIKELNTYVREHNSLSSFTYENYCTINGYNYINYTSGYHYPDNCSIFDVFEQGAVCGGISKSSCNIRQVFGIPATTVYQPGHCAWLDYRYNVGSEGNNIVYIGNNISGWPQSHCEYDRRMLCGWGNSSWRRGSYCASYALLSRVALNDYDNYQTAELLVDLSDVFPNEAIAINREALSYQNYNLDAYANLIYETAGCSESESFALMQEIIDNMYGYPLPMWDLINLLKSTHGLTSDTEVGDTMMMTYNALQSGTTITSENSLQPDACKQMANSILSLNSYAIATFSLTGEDAGVLQLVSAFSSDANLQYSLDGGESWTSANSVSKKLSDEELSQITTDNNILVRVEGMQYSYTIDITKASTPTGLYNNDLENKLIGTTTGMEWSFDGENWTLFSDAEPDLNGDKTLYVRNPANGTQFASDSVMFVYTADSDTLNKSYVSIDKISIYDCSTEATNHSQGASNTIDGNINTVWHTNWTWYSDSERYVSYEFEDAIYLSAIDYVPSQSGANGRFLSCNVYTSLDGQEWTLAASASGWGNNTDTKTITLDTPVYAKYVRVQAVSGVNSFGSAAMINFYEDLSSKLGDADMDGEIDVRDATYIQMVCAGLKDTTTKQSLLADVDGDGQITINDATQIQKYIAGLISVFD